MALLGALVEAGLGVLVEEMLGATTSVVVRSGGRDVEGDNRKVLVRLRNSAGVVEAIVYVVLELIAVCSETNNRRPFIGTSHMAKYR